MVRYNVEAQCGGTRWAQCRGTMWQQQWQHNVGAQSICGGIINLWGHNQFVGARHAVPPQPSYAIPCYHPMLPPHAMTRPHALPPQPYHHTTTMPLCPTMLPCHDPTTCPAPTTMPPCCHAPTMLPCHDLTPMPCPYHAINRPHALPLPCHPLPSHAPTVLSLRSYSQR
jgi:hypothetical protein